MSGKPKKGFDWAKWDTHFDDDEKIDELLDAQGWNGFGVFFWLCQKAYANGYYYRWSYANAATTARKMGGGIRSETVKATVGTCCQVGLFDKRLLDREGILTSRRIQRAYVDAVAKGNRSYRTVDKRYWLLNEPETSAGRIEFFETNLPGVSDSYAENADVLVENADVLIEHGPKNRTEQNRTEQKEEHARAREDANDELLPGDPEFGRVMSFFLDKINPMPSTQCVAALRDYTKRLSADVVLHALDVALDERKYSWSYIHSILRRYSEDGLTDMEAVLRSEQEFETRKRDSGGSRRRKKSLTQRAEPESDVRKDVENLRKLYDSIKRGE